MTNEKQNNLVWHDASLQKLDRQRLHGHKSFIIWFTGLSGSGKSTLANSVEESLYKHGISTYLLDGDNIRIGLNKGLGFTPKDRKENIRRIGEVSKLFVDAGIVVISAFISPYEADRRMVRNMIELGEFIEVYTKCSLEECEKRDPKGLYQKARNGEIQQFTGISSPYEPPLNPEIIVDTEVLSIEKATEEIIQYLVSHHYLSI
jgi:adenylylsulfate kinase